MLTEEMLAATIEAVAGVERLILCGDPRQLPPIGAGRPFADLVALLRDEPGSGGGVAELRTGRRQTRRGRRRRHADDVAVASMFSIDAVRPWAPTRRSPVCLPGEGDGRIQIAQLEQTRPTCTASSSTRSAARSEAASSSQTRGGDLPLARRRLRRRRPTGFDRARPAGMPSAGSCSARYGLGRAAWSGSTSLVRRTWRGTDVRMATRSWKLASPGGADRVIFADKVMCARNDHNRKAYDPDQRAEVWTVASPTARSA